VRRLWLLASLVNILSALGLAAPQGLKISLEPGAIYKRDDPGHGKTESWYFWLLVQGSDLGLEPRQVTIAALNGHEPIEIRTIEPAELRTSQLHSFTVDARTPKISPVRAMQRPELYDLKFHMTEPIAAAADSMVVTFTGKTSRGKTVSASIKVPVSKYQQKTKLVFPFRGNGIVSQGSINDGGHANFANQYALDIIGLSEETYAPQTRDKDEDDAYAGWGREIIAPADGIVVYARNDVPDNTKLNEDPDPSKWEPLPSPVTAIAGNCVIIDHQNGEFSVMMHMRQGSVKVQKGETVKAGQPIGNLGNSGDAYGPHLHYQLQNGPELFAYPSVPVVFSNVGQGKPMYRGSYFRTH